MNEERRLKIFSGYMSVEASFIVTWTFGIIVILIYMGFFQFDRTLVFQDGYMLAISTAAQNKSVMKQQNWLNENYNKQFGEKYVAAECRYFQGKVSKDEIMINSKIQMRFVPTVPWLGKQKRNTISDSIIADNYSFTQRLREMRKLTK